VVARPATATGTDAAASSSNWELYQNVVVKSGASINIDSNLSFAAFENVAVSLRCTAATSAATSMSTVTLQALWSVPGAELFSIAEFAPGSKFAYWDAGGTVFHVYGTQFRLSIQNTGNNDITLDQVVIYAPTEAPVASESTPASRRNTGAKRPSDKASHHEFVTESHGLSAFLGPFGRIAGFTHRRTKKTVDTMIVEVEGDTTRPVDADQDDLGPNESPAPR
jgi:hypothetical protein